MNKAYLGIDTSMYTTSVAVVDQNGNLLFEQRELLKVDMGKRGLQQSVAVFEHLKALPLILENMGDYSLAAI